MIASVIFDMDGLLFNTELIDEKGFNSLLADNTELIKMLTASIKTLKNKRSTL